MTTPETNTREVKGPIPLHSVTSMNDAELIRATLNQVQVAFEELMKRHTALVAAYLYGTLPNPTDTEDLMQEIFFQAYQKLGTLKDPTRFRPWLLRIAKNERTNFYRSRNRQSVVPPELLSPAESALNEADTTQNPAEQAATSEIDTLVSTAIGKLPDTYRLVLNLRLVEELKTGEIALLLDLKETTVRTRLERGLKKLRKSLQKESL